MSQKKVFFLMKNQIVIHSHFSHIEPNYKFNEQGEDYPF